MLLIINNTDSKKYGTGFVKEAELHGKIYGSLEVLILTMMGNLIMPLMELNMLMEEVLEIAWIITKTQAPVLILRKIG